MNEQEQFWQGEFGDEYIDRNNADKMLGINMALFSNVFSRTRDVESVIELGANIGMNLKAIKTILPEVEVYGLEINKRAARILVKQFGQENVYNCSIKEYKGYKQFHMVITKGVLIHQNPDDLPQIYDMMYNMAVKYIFIAEYYNPVPVAVTYRGNENKLFKRDFCGEIMARHTDLKLLDYGFCYHNDPVFPMDDINWFLLRKSI